MTDHPTIPLDRPRGRFLLGAGLGLALLGVAAFAAQVSAGRLTLPWYMPALGLLGGGFVAASWRRHRTVWRAFAVVSVLLLAEFELAFLVAVRLPAYAGPVAVGQLFPAFESRRADGSRFTQDDLAGAQNQVLLFFRGRW